MQSRPFPRYLVPPRSKYSPQHHVLKHPQLPFLPQCQRPSFTRTKILSVVLYGCEMWSFTLRDERRPRVIENGVLRWIFGPKRGEVRGKWRKLHNEEFGDLSVLLTLYCSGDKIEKNEMGGACSAYGVRGEVHTGFLWGNLRGLDDLGDPGVDGWIILRWVFRRWDVGVWTGSSWLIYSALWRRVPETEFL